MPPLVSTWRSYVIVEAVVHKKEDDRVRPDRAVAHGVNYLRDERLATLDVSGRMLIILAGDSGQSKIGVHKRNFRQNTVGQLKEEERQRQEMRVKWSGGRREHTESCGLRRILKIVGPADVVGVEQIEDRSRDRLVASRWRESVIGSQVTKRSRRQ